jgi:hypothetical protein
MPGGEAEADGEGKRKTEDFKDYRKFILSKIFLHLKHFSPSRGQGCQMVFF